MPICCVDLRDLAELHADATDKEEGAALKRTKSEFWGCWARLLPLLLVPAWCAGMTFSMMGYGDVVYDKLASVDRDREVAGSMRLYKLLVGVAAVDFVALYVADFSYWQGCWLRVRQVLTAFGLACCLLGAVLANHYYPAAAFSVFLLAVPAYVYALRVLFFRGQHIAVFTRAFAVAFGALAFVGAVSWIFWVGGWASSGFFGKTHHWNPALKAEYAHKTCNANRAADSYALTPAEVDSCLAAYMLWGSPFMASMMAAVMSLIANLFSKSFAADSIGEHGQQHGQDKQQLHAIIRMVAGGFVMLIFVMWVAASVAGANMGLSNVVLSFSAVAMLLVGVVLAKTVGTSKLMEEVHNVPLIKSMESFAEANWFRALFILVTWPVILAFVILSFLNQLVRRYCPCSKDLQEGDADDDQAAGDGDIKLVLTLKAHKFMHKMRNWNWSAVLRWISLWSLIFVVIIVGVGKGVILFLAGLNSYLSSWSYGAVVVIFYCIGLFMFLLPPVPGVPVYLAGGVILTASAWDKGKGFSFEVSCCLSVAVCFCIKMNAIAVQQKCFGERMSGSVKVRKLVGVNSTSIRAIEAILSAPGVAFLDIKKVSILCGGPDWPTSVLTGILRLSLADMMTGSIPVLFLIAPCCMSGAFMLKITPGDSKWAAISSVTLAVSACVQTSALAAAGYFIAEVTARDKKKLDAKPKDKEVEALEKVEAENAERYAAATTWDKLPCLARLNLQVGALAMALCCYACQLAGNSCFRTFEVTGEIDAPLNPVADAVTGVRPTPGLGGKASNILLPRGWLVVWLFCFGMLSYYAHGKWVKYCVPDARPLHAPGSGAAPVAMHDIEQQIGELEGQAGAKGEGKAEPELAVDSSRPTEATA